MRRTRKVLAENGKELSRIEEIEPEPSLGNGGLGRTSGVFFWIRWQHWGFAERGSD